MTCWCKGHRLRETWERAVEEVLLNGAVMRFRRGVHTQRLRHVTDIDEADVREVDAGMSRASRFMRGHDEPRAAHEPAPAPDEVAADIDALNSWIDAIRRRRR